MYTVALIIAVVALAFSLAMVADIHHKVQYTNLRDHRGQIRQAMIAQGIVMLWLVGVLLYRHVRIVNG